MILAGYVRRYSVWTLELYDGDKLKGFYSREVSNPGVEETDDRDQMVFIGRYDVTAEDFRNKYPEFFI